MNPMPTKIRRPILLGMNRRNRQFVDVFNPKKWIAVANNKVETKRRLDDLRLPTPKTLGVARFSQEIDAIYADLVRLAAGFVVKPAQSARGRGVLICSMADEVEVVPHEPPRLTRREFCFYLHRIIHGEYSGGYLQDWALIEQRIHPDPDWIFSGLPGAPDLRIIVTNGRPVMAMARIPTHYSQGRANLHCGAVGVGIDLESGETTFGVWRDRLVHIHPDTGETLTGRPVKGLEDCLRIATRCFEAIPLGYMGVDLLFDAVHGPMVIEVNARPGLSVQIANQKSLLEEIVEWDIEHE